MQKSRVAHAASSALLCLHRSVLMMLPPLLAALCAVAEQSPWVGLMLLACVHARACHAPSVICVRSAMQAGVWVGARIPCAIAPLEAQAMQATLLSLGGSSHAPFLFSLLHRPCAPALCFSLFALSFFVVCTDCVVCSSART